MVHHVWRGFGAPTSRCLATLWVGVFVLLLMTDLAWAQTEEATETAAASDNAAASEEQSEEVGESPGPAPTTPNASDEAVSELKANEAFLKARAAYDSGGYEKSLELLKSAYDLAPKAVYLVNMARAQEAMGQFRVAHENYMKVARDRGALRTLRDESMKEAERVEPMSHQAILRFRKMKKGYSVQIDGEPQNDLSQDKVLEPGQHESCLLASEGGVLYCWQRNFEAGVRVLWPPKNETQTSASAFWAGMDGSTELFLNGNLLFVNLETLTKMVLQEGQYVFEAKRKDGSISTATVNVAPGTVVRVEDLVGTARLDAQRAEAARAEAERKEAARIARAKERDPGPWPLVVSGVGGALVLGGGVLWLMSSSTRDSGGTQAEQRDAWESANSQQSTSMVLTGVGLAVAGGGLGWWWLTRENKVADEQVGLEVGIGFSGLRSVLVGGRF